MYKINLAGKKLSRKDVFHVGYQLLKRRPEVADELLNETPLPSDSNRVPSELIPVYFQLFCVVFNYDPAWLVNTKNSHHVTEIKRFFAGAILKIYHPNAWDNPNTYFQLQTGIVKHLSETIGMKKANTSNMLYQVHKWVRQYDDFEEEVNHIHSHLTAAYASQNERNDNEG